MKIDKNHEIVGRKNSELGALDIGTLYPVLADDRETVIGVFSAEHGAPDGYRLNERLQSYVRVYSAELQYSRPPQALAADCEAWEGRDYYESEEEAIRSLSEHLKSLGYHEPNAVIGEHVSIILD